MEKAPEVPIDQHRRLEMTVLMTPDTANFSGNVHGGHILKLLDQVAYACASRYSGGYVVTGSVDQVIFRERTQVGELVTFLSSVNYTGGSSMEVGIRVIAEEITSQTFRHVITCYFTMVALDAEGKPRQLAPLSIEDRSVKQLGEPRFVVDNHLGRLAVYLRMLGFDTLYRNDYDDDELAQTAGL
ncbi:MAG: hypothetical protein HGA19_12770, partial [Oscillochloris sp.]|nr:hypothetical protein [Oscillochloris sp.]